MSNIKLTATKTITTADGENFTDRKAALAHGTYLAQKANLDAAKFDTRLLVESDSGGWKYLQDDHIGAFIAANAALILAALTVKQARKPRTPKVVPASVTG